ncbi:UNVERIFIED_CONTAM: hypothetical protein GTU68_026254 [Idotea baltica]|nr:hypothetical protein [Idotea baltica]
MPNILIVDDEPAVVSLVCKAIEKLDGYTTVKAASSAEARERLADDNIDVAVIDVLLPDESGFELMRHVQQLDARLPVIFITGGGTSGTAIEAMKAGAFDYLSKPLNVKHLKELVEHAADVRRLMTTSSSDSDLLVGRSTLMTDVYKAIGRVAPKNVTVLIRGESGTGKELVARSIYQHSDRADKPFLAVNCAAIPEALLESELFGHEKGAFTGADRQRIGKFEQCNDGTIFLDEIGDMPLALQSKILRLIQDQRFERVGGNETIQTSVRIVTATHRDLEAMAEQGKFRADLYYRLNVYEIVIPSLRKRPDDLPTLVGHFLMLANKELDNQVTSVSDVAMKQLQAYDWPGNVRELQSVLKKSVLNASGPLLLPEFLPSSIREFTPSVDAATGEVDDSRNINEWEHFLDSRLDAGTNSLYDDTLEKTERWLIRRVLRHTKGNQVQAANLLGITRTTLRSKLGKLGISIEKVIDES